MRKDNQYVLLTVSIHQEDDQFVAKCVELGTASCGYTLDEARANIMEAVLLHLNTLEELGEREDVFRERGIKIHKKQQTIAESTVTLNGIELGSWASRVQVPVAAGC